VSPSAHLLRLELWRGGWRFVAVAFRMSVDLVRPPSDPFNLTVEKDAAK